MSRGTQTKSTEQVDTMTVETASIATAAIESGTVHPDELLFDKDTLAPLTGKVGECRVNMTVNVDGLVVYAGDYVIDAICRALDGHDGQTIVTFTNLSKTAIVPLHHAVFAKKWTCDFSTWDKIREESGCPIETTVTFPTVNDALFGIFVMVGWPIMSGAKSYNRNTIDRYSTTVSESWKRTLAHAEKNSHKRQCWKDGDHGRVHPFDRSRTLARVEYVEQRLNAAYDAIR